MPYIFWKSEFEKWLINFIYFPKHKCRIPDEKETVQSRGGFTEHGEVALLQNCALYRFFFKSFNTAKYFFSTSYKNSSFLGHKIQSFFWSTEANGVSTPVWMHSVKRRCFTDVARTTKATACSVHFRQEDYLPGYFIEFQMGCRSWQNCVRLLAHTAVHSMPQLLLYISTVHRCRKPQAGVLRHSLPETGTMHCKSYFLLL